MHDFGHARRALVVGATLAIALSGTALSPATAHAVTQETEAKLTETQKKVEDSASSYSEAVQSVSDLQTKIDETSARIAELESQLPDLQKKASLAMRDLYKAHQGSGFMSFLFGSQSLDDLITKMAYQDRVQESNVDAVKALDEAQGSLEKQKVELEQAKAKADAEAKAAATALEEAKALRQQAQEQADAEAAAELAELQRAAEELANANASSGSVDSSQVATPDSGSVNWDADEASFVAQWAPRIDAYLAGSPLEGYGATFASAAWKYGVDPRWSPAISNTESSKGRYCFREHNAWGWGAIDFDSWEQAIDTHVRGLARGYGYTISVEAAKKYCPPNWYHWYTTTLAEMETI